MEVAEVRDTDAPASGSDRMAHARRGRSQAGTAIANPAAHWTGYGSDTGFDSGPGSGPHCSSFDSGTGSGSGPCDPAAVHDPQQHKAGEARHGRGTRRRRDPVEVNTRLISNINDNAGGK